MEVDVVGGTQVDERVHGGVSVATGGIGFDGDVHGLEPCAEPSDGRLVVRVGRVGVQKTRLAFDGLAGAAKALGSEARGDQTAHGGVTGMEGLVPCAVEKKLHRARGLAAAQAEGIGNLVRREPEHPGRRGGGAEYTAGGGRMEAPRVVVAGLQGDAQANLHLVSGDDAGDDIPAGGAGHLGGGKGGGNDGCAGVDGAARMGVVEIQRVGKIAVVKSRRRRCVPTCITDDAAGSSAQAELCQRRRHGVVEGGRVAGAKRDANVIHGQQTGAFNHLSGQFVEIQSGGEFGQLAGYGDHFGHSSSSTHCGARRY